MANIFLSYARKDLESVRPQLDDLLVGLVVHRQRGLDEAYAPFLGAFGAAWTTPQLPAGAPTRSG